MVKLRGRASTTTKQYIAEALHLLENASEILDIVHDRSVETPKEIKSLRMTSKEHLEEEMAALHKKYKSSFCYYFQGDELEYEEIVAEFNDKFIKAAVTVSLRPPV